MAASADRARMTWFAAVVVCLAAAGALSLEHLRARSQPTALWITTTSPLEAAVEPDGRRLLDIRRRRFTAESGDEIEWIVRSETTSSSAWLRRLGLASGDSVVTSWIYAPIDRSVRTDASGREWQECRRVELDEIQRVLRE